MLAEGIETLNQLDLLRDEACDEGQGFFLGRPAPLDALTGVEESLLASPALRRSAGA